MKPFGNQILIQPDKKEQVLVSDQGTLCEYGEVLAIGEDVKRIKVGDKIIFTIWGVNAVEIGNEKYHFIPEDNNFILGTL
jgi:co-chaperonin GroES (HSP10)